MVDTVSPAVRSEIMRRVRGKDTGPEMVVRRLVHSLGYRYRLHAKDLPGTPDLVFRSRRKVVFVHGCFWHYHSPCEQCRIPKSRVEFWTAKLERNSQRDRKNLEALTDAGWGVQIVWECELKDRRMLEKRLKRFLGPPGQRQR
jgi:DNA mismatch endonuclease, patch repair protein